MYNYNSRNKKNRHIRSESERKDKVTSIRCSEEQYEKIQKNAKKAGMSVTNYLVTTGANGGGALTPELLVKIQNQINYACSAVEESAPEKVKKMQEGVNELWQKLI